MINYDSMLIFVVEKCSDYVKTLLLTLVLLAVAIVLLGVKVLFVNGSKFPSGHAHDVMNRGKRSTHIRKK
ncbi:MAG: hypothetical protein K2L93_04965 [Muribaculaceae bacterium]|nr:hypothetical protein [Muribaculaceae bacterium]